MTPRSRYSAQIVVSVTPETRELLQGMASDEGVSVAHVARKLLDAGLSAPGVSTRPEPAMNPQQLRTAARQLVKTGEAADFAEALTIVQETAETSEDPDTI